jgi:hypothetical protein
MRRTLISKDGKSPTYHFQFPEYIFDKYPDVLSHYTGVRIVSEIDNSCIIFKTKPFYNKYNLDTTDNNKYTLDTTDTKKYDIFPLGRNGSFKQYPIQVVDNQSSN